MCVREEGVSVVALFLGGFELGVGAEASAVEGRLGLQVLALEQSLRLLLLFGNGALARVQVLFELAGALACTAVTEPVADDLQVSIDLYWVIAASETSRKWRCTTYTERV